MISNGDTEFGRRLTRSGLRRALRAICDVIVLQQIVRARPTSARAVAAGGWSLAATDASADRDEPAPHSALEEGWRKKGLDGLLDAPRSGRPNKLTLAKEGSILTATEGLPSGSTTHWSTRRLARRLGLSSVTVVRVWHKAGCNLLDCDGTWPARTRTLQPRPKTSSVCTCNRPRTQQVSAPIRNEPCRCDPPGRNGTPSRRCGTEPSRCWPPAVYHTVGKSLASTR
jgi:plasmid stabilization system protein ParE